MNRRDLVISWIEAALEEVDPSLLVKQCLGDIDPSRPLAIGKAAPGMVNAFESKSALCVTNRPSRVPDTTNLLVGDHPVPGERSFEAGHTVLEFAAEATVALLSGGGSSLCELPIAGLERTFVSEVGEALLHSGLHIEEVNMVRTHISQIKGGGLGPIPTLVLSDVAGEAPSVVASGPTCHVDRDPKSAIEVMRGIGVTITAEQKRAIEAAEPPEPFECDITAIGDGKTAGTALCKAAETDGVPGAVRGRWLTGRVHDEIDEFLAGSEEMLVAVGEPTLAVAQSGAGGRNTHTALEAARRIAGTKAIFAAVATDGRDGNTAYAGAIVDGGTIERGGDPTGAIQSFNSARYLAETGDLLMLGDTGTNVSDIWMVWR